MERERERQRDREKETGAEAIETEGFGIEQDAMIWDKKSYVEIVMTNQWRGRVLGLKEEMIECQVQQPA